MKTLILFLCILSYYLVSLSSNVSDPGFTGLVSIFYVMVGFSKFQFFFLPDVASSGFGFEVCIAVFLYVAAALFVISL